MDTSEINQNTICFTNKRNIIKELKYGTDKSSFIVSNKHTDLLICLSVENHSGGTTDMRKTNEYFTSKIEQSKLKLNREISNPNIIKNVETRLNLMRSK